MATPRRRWTREELLVALNLYHKLTFGQFHARQPAIIALAGKLERTPDSLAMKLCNFASLDPALAMRGIRGLAGASQLDRHMWEEFHADLADAVPASEEKLRALFSVPPGAEVEVVPKKGIQVRRNPPGGPTDVTVTIKQRRGQEYFRNAVLNNFGGQCGISRLAVRELLVASHILPWSVAETERLNVRNGLCLSRLHDAAFDLGLIAFDEAMRLVLSPRLRGQLDQQSVRDNFGAYVGEPLQLPDDAALPDERFLAEHYARVFKKS